MEGSDVWVWRDEAARANDAGVDGDDHAGWRLDADGAWRWDGPVGPQRSGTIALRPAPRVPAARRPDSAEALEPIFNALTADHNRRSTLRAVRDDGPVPFVPEPHPGSGPLPIQHANRPGERRPQGLAEVPTVPPPGYAGVDADSPEDELRRRAERRRRPRAAEESRAGRHALRAQGAARGRHAMG